MIIITGASRGIGLYLFETFFKTDDSVYGTFLNSKPTQNNENYFQLDTTCFEQVDHFVSSNNEKLKEIVLINCAGITYNAFTHKSDSLKWKKVIDTNVFGTYNMIRALLPLMREQKYGRIINFSSVVALKPTPGISSYAASKSALWGLSKSIAIENASHNITINNINLGYSELGMIQEVPEEFKKKIINQIPAGELCNPIDILNTVKYLISTKYINGSSIDLSGGLI
jgi:acetoacetyl-CoA reductase/3-oxoacyl-[acyl-carrier protein] reductase